MQTHAYIHHRKNSINKFRRSQKVYVNISKSNVSTITILFSHSICSKNKNNKLTDLNEFQGKEILFTSFIIGTESKNNPNLNVFQNCQNILKKCVLVLTNFNLFKHLKKIICFH